MRVIMLLVLLLAALPIDTQAQTMPIPEACWPLDEEVGVRGDSASTYHLTDNNTVTALVGQVGNTAVFAASNTEWLSYTDTAALSYSQFTIIGWFRANTLPGVRANVLGKGTTSESVGRWSEYKLYVDSAGSIHASVNNAAETTAADTVSPITVSPLVWYFFAITFDGSDIQLTVDTTPSTPATIADHADTGSFAIGRAGLAAANYWDGRIDEVAIYDSVLTSDQISEIYNSGNGRSCDELVNGLETVQLTAATIYTTTLPSGGTGSLSMSYTAGEVAITAVLGIVALILFFSLLKEISHTSAKR